MKTNIKYSLLLVLTAVIWGAAFVAQSAGMDYVGPFTFNGIRCLIGATVLAPVAMFFDKKDGVMTSWKNRDLVLGGCICGILLFLATSSQQVGIIYTTAGKAGFITALYIVLVPIFSFMLKRKPPKQIWISVCLSMVGLYFLCLSETFRLSPGDIWMFVCAILFALQIVAVDKFAPHMDVIKLSCYQFAVSGILSIIPMIQEKPVMGDILDCWLPLVYAGALSGGVAYTLQMEAQKRVNATVACIIMSLESVFSAVFGFLILGQRLSGREIIGCVTMFAAVILAQITPAKKE